MLLPLEHQNRAELGERLRNADAVSAEIMSDVIGHACRRFALLGKSEKSYRLEQLLESGASIDAALALIAPELPQWQPRRIAYDEGEWHCALSRQRELPDWLERSTAATPISPWPCCARSSKSSASAHRRAEPALLASGRTPARCMNRYFATTSVERSCGFHRRWSWDGASMFTITCDDKLVGGRTGQKPSVAVHASPAHNEPQPVADTSFRRPGAEDLSEAIAVFFIGRNKQSHWVARGADGKSGGLFWRKQAAIGFARRSAWPARCATVLPAETIELDLENQGNPLQARIDVTRMLRIAGAAVSALLWRPLAARSA